MNLLCCFDVPNVDARVQTHLAGSYNRVGFPNLDARHRLVMKCIVSLHVQLRVQDYHILTANVDEFFIGSLVLLSRPILKRVADVIDADAVDPFGDRIELLTLLLARLLGQ